MPALITRTDTHTKFHSHMSPLFEININPSSSSQNERKVKGIFDCCFDYKLESTMALHTRTLLSSAFYFIMCFTGERLSCAWGRCGEGWRRDRWAVLHICTGWTSKRTHRRKYVKVKKQNKTKKIHHERDLLVISSLAEGSQDYWTMEKIT